MNVTILRAQVWSLFRLTWLELIVRFLTPLALVCAIMRTTGIVDYFAGSFLLECLLLSSLTSLLWLKSFEHRATNAFPFQLGFVHPIPDLWLAALPLGWLMLTNALLYVTLASVTQLVLGHPFPVFSMIPFILLATAGIAMLAWSSTRFVERVIGAILLGFIMFRWFQGRLSVLDSVSVAPLDWAHAFRSTPMELMLGFGGSLLFSLICIASIRRQRHGDTEPLLGWRDLFSNSFSERLERRAGFTSTREAQGWFEYRRAGFRGVGITLVAIFMLATGLSATASGADLLGGLLFYSALFFSPLVLVVAVTEGVLGLDYRGHTSRLSPYEATLPRTESTSVLLKLGVALGITLNGWGAISLATHGIFEAMDPDIPIPSLSKLLAKLVSHHPPNIAMWFAMWSVIGFALVIALCAATVLVVVSVGYFLPRIRKHVVWAASLTFCAIVPIPVSIVEDLTGNDLQILFDLWLVVWGVFLVGTTAFSLHKLHQGGHSGRLFILGCTFCWTALLAMTLSLSVDGGFDPFQVRLPVACFTLGLLSIPLASIAWAPLSLAALRHQ